MSRENLEIVRQLLVDDVDVVPLLRDDAASARRRPELEALVEADSSFVWIAEGQRAIEAVGLDDGRRGWLDWLAPWESYRVRIERITEVGDMVVVLSRNHGRMAGTQNDVELLAASVYHVRDKKVAGVEHYANRDDALAAVGLRE